MRKSFCWFLLEQGVEDVYHCNGGISNTVMEARRERIWRQVLCLITESQVEVNTVNPSCDFHLFMSAHAFADGQLLQFNLVMLTWRLRELWMENGKERASEAARRVQKGGLRLASWNITSENSMDYNPYNALIVKKINVEIFISSSCIKLSWNRLILNSDRSVYHFAWSQNIWLKLFFTVAIPIDLPLVS